MLSATTASIEGFHLDLRHPAGAHLPPGGTLLQDLRLSEMAVGDIAQHLDAAVEGLGVITAVSNLEHAGPNEIAWMGSAAYLGKAAGSAAGAIIIPAEGSLSTDASLIHVTRMADGVETDNQVHVGHNAVIGDHSILIAMTASGGSSVLGHHVVLSGHCGVTNHVRIGNGVQCGAYSIIMNDVPDGAVLWGRVGVAGWRDVPVAGSAGHVRGCASRDTLDVPSGGLDLARMIGRGPRLSCGLGSLVPGSGSPSTVPALRRLPPRAGRYRSVP